MIMERTLESLVPEVTVDTMDVVVSLESWVDTFGQHMESPFLQSHSTFVKRLVGANRQDGGTTIGTCEGNLLLVKLPTLLIDVPAIRDCPPTIFVSMSLGKSSWSLAQFRDPTWSLAEVPV